MDSNAIARDSNAIGGSKLNAQRVCMTRLHFSIDDGDADH